jgi:hypothetical protein
VSRGRVGGSCAPDSCSRSPCPSLYPGVRCYAGSPSLKELDQAFSSFRNHPVQLQPINHFNVRIRPPVSVALILSDVVPILREKMNRAFHTLFKEVERERSSRFDRGYRIGELLEEHRQISSHINRQRA